MRAKHLILPFALVVPVLFAPLLLNPPSADQSFAESGTATAPERLVALPTQPTASVNAKPSTNALTRKIDLDPVQVLTLLNEIALDENNLPVVDDQLKRQLDNAVRLIGRERTPAELDMLSELIKDAVRPETAQSINQILFQYYAYKMAEEDYTRSFNSQNPADASNTTKTLSDLRESYLGHDLAKKLFGQENIYHSYMEELATRLSAPDLSDEMRNSITSEVRNKYYPAGNQAGDL
jgi:hypothetical protein